MTYTGSALEPCSAKVTGAGGLDQALEVGYGDNTTAGTATASASYGGDANHESSSADSTFTIAKAPTTVTVTCSAGPFVFTGSAFTPCSAAVSGVGLSESVVVVYTDNVGPGTATATATYAGDANHLGDTDSAAFVIDDSVVLKGFYAPVDLKGVLNVVKGGSTVPLKFEAFAGTSELTSTSAVKSFTQAEVSCDGSALTDEIEGTSTGGTSLRYDSTSGQFIQNWQTPRSAGTCYKVTITTQGGTELVALFRLK